MITSKRVFILVLIFLGLLLCLLLGYQGFNYFRNQNEEIQRLKKQVEATQQLNNQSETKLSKEQACRKANELLNQIKDSSACGMMPFPGIDECIKRRQDAAKWINYQPKPDDPVAASQEEKNNLDRVYKMQQLKEPYLSYKARCGE